MDQQEREIVDVWTAPASLKERRERREGEVGHEGIRRHSTRARFD